MDDALGVILMDYDLCAGKFLHPFVSHGVVAVAMRIDDILYGISSALRFVEKPLCFGGRINEKCFFRYFTRDEIGKNSHTSYFDLFHKHLNLLSC